MLRIKGGDRPERKILRSLKSRQLLAFFLFFVFLSSLPFNLLAKTEKTVSLSLNLEEWLVLEVISGNSQVNDLGQRQAQVEVTIIPGQPVFIRALFSVGYGKRVILKGALFTLEKLDSNSDLKWKWQAEGDLIGRGFINLDEPETLAIWQNNGFKTGTVIFENMEESISFPIKGIFTLLSF